MKPPTMITVARLAAFFAVLSLISGCVTIGRACAPIYGNWCGQGYPLPGKNPKPVDEWDQACKEHDKCYEKYGYGSEGCDKLFIRTIDRLKIKNEVECEYGEPEEYDEIEFKAWERACLGAPKNIEISRDYFAYKTGQISRIEVYFDLDDMANYFAGNCAGADIGRHW